MAAQNFLIMNLLRLITPEEIGDIATKHNSGKFLALTDLVNERVDHKIYRDFSSVDSMEQIHEAHSAASQAKILPFVRPGATPDELESDEVHNTEDDTRSLTEMLDSKIEVRANKEAIKEEIVEHNENENMSTFIMIEKARLKRSQHSLKQKEIIDLYQKNSNVDVEQIKNTNNNLDQAKDAGVLVNKKQF